MKSILLDKILCDGKALYCAYDHGLEHGPDDFDEKDWDPNYILDIALKGAYQAVILHKGIAEKYYAPWKGRKKVALILKVNGKSKIFQGDDPYSPRVCSVNYALKLGAAAVGYTIYLGSKEERLMFAEFGALVEEAHNAGIPAIAWIYPRGEFVKDDDSREITAYAARCGLELGTDIIKIKYSGSYINFAHAVKMAGRAKVVLSGGPKVSDEEFLKIVKATKEAGAIGVAVGRNVWQHQQPLEMTRKIREILGL